MLVLGLKIYFPNLLELLLLIIQLGEEKATL